MSSVYSANDALVDQVEISAGAKRPERIVQTYSYRRRVVHGHDQNSRERAVSEQLVRRISQLMLSGG